MSKITITDDAGRTQDITLPDTVTLTIAPPVVVDPPAPPAVTLVGQTLTSDRAEIRVGDKFTLTAVQNYSDGTSKPVKTYRLYYFDKRIVTHANDWAQTFTALSAGTTTIRNDTTGSTGSITITVLDADSAPPVDPPGIYPPPVVDPPAPPVDPPAPPQPMPGIPANDNARHTIVATVTDGAGRVYTASATRGNDPTADGDFKPLLASDSTPHRTLNAMFYDDCVEVGVTRMDAAYDEMNCTLAVTYDGEPAAVPPSSYADGHYDFWRGGAMPPIRYGKQLALDATLIDWSMLPSYTKDKQNPYSDAKCNYTFNGLGNASTGAMATTGERGEIGFYAQAMMAYLLDPSPANAARMRRTDDWAGVWPVCWRDPATGNIIDVTKYPDANVLSAAQQAGIKKNPIAVYRGSYNGDMLTPPVDAWKVTKCPNVPNGAHLTSYCMLTPMVCPTARDKDQCAFWANWPLLEIGPTYTKTGGVMLGAQRRAAWCLRNLFLASYLSSATDYFKDNVSANLVVANAIQKNEFGILATTFSYTGEGSAAGCTGVAIWMQSYDMLTLDAVANKLPEWRPFAQFVGTFYALIGALPQAPLATIYSWICRGGDGNMIRVYKDSGRADAAGGPIMEVDITESLMQQLRHSLVSNGWTDAQAAAITVPGLTEQDVYNQIKAMGPSWAGKFANGVSDFRGAPTSADSYPSTMIMATTAASNVGTPGIEAALHKVQNLPTYPAWSTNQKYHLVPRETA